MFKGPFDESIIKRAIDKSLVEINIHDLRKWGLGTHKQVDDRPFGGGTGMIMMIEPINRALSALKIKNQKSKIKMTNQNSKTILLSPSGNKLTQQKAMELSKLDHLILICGHYEGVDQRVSDNLTDEEISIGDYVLTGG
jgi:tRNA (guanine37-N1)-methyltransferase